ncbi:MAG: hypothetical protein OXF79_02770 [Chloroflexi bacterium]|nr:hypothetical protein [Chloroflexota bacterium]
MWKKIGNRVWGAGFAFSGIVGLGGLQANVLNWIGWLKINPYVTGAAFGIMGLCGILYVVSRWGDRIIALWDRSWMKLRGFDRHAMAILRKEEPRLEALCLEIAEYRDGVNRGGSHPSRILLDLLAVEDLLNILGVPTPAVIGTGRDLDIVLTEWAMFVPLLLVRIRHGNIDDVRSTLDTWNYVPAERLHDIEPPVDCPVSNEKNAVP